MLQIDMTEEPADENDRIFLATNQWVGGGYVLVTPEAEKIAVSAQAIVNIGRQMANVFSTAFAPVLQALREADEQQARDAKFEKTDWRCKHEQQ